MIIFSNPFKLFFSQILFENFLFTKFIDLFVRFAFCEFNSIGFLFIVLTFTLPFYPKIYLQKVSLTNSYY